MPTNEHAAVFAPISLVKPNAFIPSNYILHIKSKHCTGCGCLTNESQLYALNFIRSQWGKGSPVQNLVPVDKFSFNIPIARKHLGTITVPYCHECPAISLEHLPSPPEPDRVTINVMGEPQLRNKPKNPNPPKKAATLADLA